MANPNTTEEARQPLQKPGDYVPATYAPPAQTATYEPIYDELQRQIADYVNRTDPQKQAEQDARTQRGRSFWTGANLFTNVIANAINARGTANGAPNMTWNDAASQKMYDTWRDQDKELKADRKAAQQRLDALRLQDAQFRMADAQARDKAALEAYKINYQNQEAANQAKHEAEVKEFEKQEARQQKLQDDETAYKREIDFYDYQRKHPMPSRTGGGRATATDNGKYSVWAGGIEIPGKNAGEQKSNTARLVNMMVAAMNKDRSDNPFEIDPNKKRIDASEIKNPEWWVSLNFDNLYGSDDDFAKAFNEAFVGQGEEKKPKEEPKQRVTYPTVKKNGFGLKSPDAKPSKQETESPFDFSKL